MSKSRFILFLAFLVLTPLLFGEMFLGSAHAKEYPEKPLVILCPFGAGTGADRIVRTAIPYMKEAIGQQIVVEYKEGGGGVMGANYFMTTKADGYTLLVYNYPHIMVQEKFQRTAFGMDKLVPLLGLTNRPEVIMVKSTSPFKTFKEFVDYAKKNPKKITIGTTGSFASGHLTVAMMEKAAGIQVTRVAYESGAKVLTSLLGDHTDASVSNMAWMTVHPGQLRPLVSASEERLTADVPTFKEMGYDVVCEAVCLIFLRKGAPEPVITFLRNKWAPIRGNEKLRKDYLTQDQDPTVFDWKGCEELATKMVKRIKETEELMKAQTP